MAQNSDFEFDIIRQRRVGNSVRFDNVNGSPLKAGLQRLLRIEKGNYGIVQALSVVMSICTIPYLSSNPDGSDQLDSSWASYMYTVIYHHFHFGTQYVWTYGPLGFTEMPILVHRTLLLVAILVQLIISILFGILLANAVKDHLSAGTASLLVVLAFLPGGINLEYKSTLAALIVLYFTYNATKDHLVYRLIGVGILLALAPLVKSSMLTTTITIVLVYIAVKWREHGAIVLFLPVSVCVFWLFGFSLAGQTIGSAFLTPISQIQLIEGYVAMALHGPLVYIGFAVVLILALLPTLIGNIMLRNIGLVLSVMLLLFEAYKEGFTRQDAHVYAFFTVVIWCSILLLLGVVAEYNVRFSHLYNWGTIVAVALSDAIVLGGGGDIFPGVLRNLQGVRVASQYIVDARYAQDTSKLQNEQIVQARPGISYFSSVMAGKPSFDWPWDINALRGIGARIDQPPIPQEYSVYTPKLDAVDASFFASKSAPSWGVLSLASIDGRLPLQTPPQTFRALLSNYSPIVINNGYLLVHRETGELNIVQQPTEGRLKASVGEWVSVPKVPQGLVFAQIHIKRTFEGDLSSLMYREAPLYLSERLSDGRVLQYRLVQSTLSDGILVSVSPQSIDDLALDWLGNSLDRVTRFSITANRPSEWGNQYDIRWIRVVNARQGTQLVDRFGARSKLLQGHVDSIASVSGTSALRLQGWFIGGNVLVNSHYFIGVPYGPEKSKFRLYPLVRVTRPDVVAVLGPKVTPFSGFEAIIPNAHFVGNLPVYEFGRGRYTAIGRITVEKTMEPGTR